MISLLVAMDRNRVIGYQNELPWYLPNDLKFFKQKTTGNTIIMGRKTFEAIGRALPNRRNVVISNQGNQFPEGIDVIRDTQIILDWNNQHPDDEFFVIGGGNIFKQILPHANRMYITLINDVFQGDTYFPEFTEADWQLTASEKGLKDSKNPYDYYFLQYDR